MATINLENEHLAGGICVKDMKKIIKNNKALIVPIENAKKGLIFCGVGKEIYAPVPQYNKKETKFFKVDKITFVTQDDLKESDENVYYMAIEYLKNRNKHFYSYDPCSEKIKTAVCEKFKNLVEINIRNKDDLYKKVTNIENEKI